MLRYILKRFLHMLLVMFIALTIVFFILRCIGDPAKLLLNPEGTQQDLTDLRASLGLDKPLFIQYVDYLNSIIHLDFGNSYRFDRPVLEIIGEYVPATLILAGTAILFALPLALFCGVVSACKRNTIFDTIVTAISMIGKAMPAFWLGLLLVLLFGVKLGWLPPSGYGSWKQLVMPAFTLAAGLCASTTRLTRSSMLDVMGQDYITTAHSKGISESRVTMNHGFRNALISVVTVIALQIGTLLGGAAVVETVFAWPGIGRLTVNSISNYDFPLVQACALMMTLIFSVINFATDILYTVIDPRIRFTK